MHESAIGTRSNESADAVRISAADSVRAREHDESRSRCLHFRAMLETLDRRRSSGAVGRARRTANPADQKNMPSGL
jgi:hypothetical protein